MVIVLSEEQQKRIKENHLCEVDPEPIKYII